jgi:TPP-dependent 2-oxoacid decarboxylase
MGFGLPSALGAAAAYAEEGREAKVVVDIDGDGSFLMNVQVKSRTEHWRTKDLSLHLCKTKGGTEDH